MECEEVETISKDLATLKKTERTDYYRLGVFAIKDGARTY